MITTVSPARLFGAYAAPPSKSDAHRALICAALADGFSHVSPLAPCADVEATITALAAFEAKVQYSGDTALIQGMSGQPTGHVRIYCNESGSTLRFLIPLAAAFGMEAVFTGSGKLPLRPLSLYHSQLPQKGVALTRLEGDELPLRVSGSLLPGRYELAGNVSSQFITGLLFSLPLLDGDSELVLTSPLESKPYVDMTLSTLARFGVKVTEMPDGYRVPGRQRFLPCTYTVEGDYSNAAFFAAAGCLCDEGVAISGLDERSTQGDRAILPLLSRFGARVTHENGVTTVRRGTLRGIEIDAAQIPDLVPILCVVGAFAPGRTHIYNALRLRLKESDRIASTTEMLTRLGAHVEANESSITVYGGQRLRGGAVDACNDHRIAMSAAIAALFCENDVVILGAQCVDKSYPKFFEDYNQLGGKADVNMGEPV